MASTKSDLENILVGERELWLEGPPHEVFAQLRSECPVHWTSKITEYPQEDGYWSVTRAGAHPHSPRSERASAAPSAVYSRSLATSG